MSRLAPTQYVARAQAALAAGFTTKTAQQQAVSDVGRAYELIKREITDTVLTEASEKFGASEGNWTARSQWINEQGYYDLPDYLHNLRIKHHPFLRDRKAEVEALHSLLCDIKAAPVNKAPAQPTKQQIEDAAKMTCQCCGRPICANTGVIAHHGYERPGWGWQTASCEGARELPFEASRDALGRYLLRLKARRLDLKKSLKLTDVEGEQFALTLTDYDEKRTFGLDRKQLTICASERSFDSQAQQFPRTMSTAGIRSWDGFLAQVKKRLLAQISGIDNELSQQQSRYNGWSQTHQWNADAQEWEQVK